MCLLCGQLTETAKIIKQKQSQEVPCIFGSATQSTPVQVYKELVCLDKEEG
ncbi:unnamed protein product [Paramecium sonneborni]|uniref:Uncharacterized protein n=1 Tax=Paramecium sonneborni TaxID=65129 RepID=A0A8S1QHS3_9CILI|nr:unnamed protein product [Paramecium sonneborni]